MVSYVTEEQRLIHGLKQRHRKYKELLRGYRGRERALREREAWALAVQSRDARNARVLEKALRTVMDAKSWGTFAEVQDYLRKVLAGLGLDE